MSDNIIKKIKVGTTTYNIEADGLSEEAESVIKGLTIKDTKPDKDTGTTKAELLFNCIGKNNQRKSGTVNLNRKGNLSIESLDNHVNLEAAKAIQIKPTTNVIFDSSRRIDAEAGNEVHLEFRDDDYKDRTNPDDEYAELKIEARNIDLRCREHGGIALQICGKDKDNNEDKVKFESSRITPVGGSNPIYLEEGGKGLEFGTFNNNISSLFSKEYRINKTGIISAAERLIIYYTGTDNDNLAYVLQQDGYHVYDIETKEIDENLADPQPTSSMFIKADYETQNDDFKDICDSNLTITFEELMKAVLAIKKFASNASSDPGDLVNAINSEFDVSPL